MTKYFAHYDDEFDPITCTCLIEDAYLMVMLLQHTNINHYYTLTIVHRFNKKKSSGTS